MATTSPTFERYIGIDYSGRGTTDDPLAGLAVFEAYASASDTEPARILPATGKRTRWSRASLATWLMEELARPLRTLVGIGHAFSLPLEFLQSQGALSWDAFLQDFVRRCPLHQTGQSVSALRNKPTWAQGAPSQLRLTERWTAGAKSAFLFDVNGAVAASSHCGIAWLREYRRALGSKLHVWPFDGWRLFEAHAVLVEVYPALFKRRYARPEGLNPHEFDAYAVAAWLSEMDARGALSRYFEPPLAKAERAVAELEGWILGVG